MDPNSIDPQVLQMLIQAAMKGGGADTGGLQQELGAYDAMGPEGYKQLSGMGTLEQRGQLAQQGTHDQMGLLNQQMGMAHDFAQPVGRNYGTVGGNIGGGISDALRAFAGGRQMASIGEQQKAALAQGQATQAGMLNQMDAGRLNAGTARFSALRDFLASHPQAAQQMQQAPMMGQAARPGFGTPQLQMDPQLLALLGG